ncbi:hypothetical protein IFM89_024367 [Coptis chinensis]|uniref:Uncharacterized protein n=1 Tax=Coptis chinensis TaxID=261450 RepID=A0A835IXL1_9MAGN|nr:hypothetical protein IFM89_024367 [Coptis chinensis]
MASSLSSSLGLISRPKLKFKFYRYKQQVRAQALGDEGRSINMVDANMKVLRERIEEIRTKERLHRTYRGEHGWCYSSGYDHMLKRDTMLTQSLELLAMACRTFGLTIATSSLFLCILSIVVHLRLLDQ